MIQTGDTPSEGAATIMDFEHLRQLATGRLLTPEEVDSALTQVGRNQEPWAVYRLIAYGYVGDDVAARIVVAAWSGAELPQACLSQTMWRELFETVGYTVGGVRSSRPESAITLYRGAAKPHRRRWSWTSDQFTAERFAIRRAMQFGSDEGGDLWRAEVEPWRLFANIGEGGIGRGEFEFVIDTRGLKVDNIPFSEVAQRSENRLSSIKIVQAPPQPET